MMFPNSACCFSTQLSVAVCVGFLVAWSPYAGVAMWAAFVNPEAVPPVVFATAAVFAKSSTLYNPLVYLGFKPNFRRSLRRRTLCSCLCRPETVQKNTGEENCHRSHKSNGPQKNQRTCRLCQEHTCGQCSPPQRTVRLLTGCTHSEVAISQLSNEMQSDFL